MENTILRMIYLHFEVWSDVYVQKKNTETDINSMWRKAIWRSLGDRLLRWYIIKNTRFRQNVRGDTGAQKAKI